MGGIVLHRPGPKREYATRYPQAGPLLTGTINRELIAAHWGDMLRLAASFKFGHATVSLVVGKLSASSLQNTLAAALKEWGALRPTCAPPHAGRCASATTSSKPNRPGA